MDDIPLDGKRVILRVDFNVSCGPDGEITDHEDYRIEATLDTIQELRRRRCKVIILPRRGRPEKNPKDADIRPAWQKLQDLLKEDIKLVSKLYGEAVEAAVQAMEPGSIIILPNVRTDEREKKPNEKFARQLAAAGEVFVSESFSEVHRARTSLTLLPQLLASCAGRRTVAEVDTLTRLREQPRRPYVAIVSGVKIVTKIGMLHELLRKVDTLCVGGQIANVFLAAQGQWKRDFNANEIEAAKAILSAAGPKLLVPTDVVIGAADGSGVQEVSVDAIPANAEDLWDIGPQSTHAIVNVCRTANTVMWNGPVGKFEVGAYSLATKALADALAKMKAYRVVGGGDTVNVLEKLRVTNQYDHVSVGGGAMIAMLEGKFMPGLEPLYTSESRG